MLFKDFLVHQLGFLEKEATAFLASTKDQAVTCFEVEEYHGLLMRAMYLNGLLMSRTEEEADTPFIVEDKK